MYPNGWPDTSIYKPIFDSTHNIRVAESLYMAPAFIDTIKRRILDSRLIPSGREYIYSDNDFIFLGQVVESITGMRLDRYVRETFYEPLGLVTTTFQAPAAVCR